MRHPEQKARFELAGRFGLGQALLILLPLLMLVRPAGKEEQIHRSIGTALHARAHPLAVLHLQFRLQLLLAIPAAITLPGRAPELRRVQLERKVVQVIL